MATHYPNDPDFDSGVGPSYLRSPRGVSDTIRTLSKVEFRYERQEH